MYMIEFGYHASDQTNPTQTPAGVIKIRPYQQVNLNQRQDLDQLGGLGGPWGWQQEQPHGCCNGPGPDP